MVELWPFPYNILRVPEIFKNVIFHNITLWTTTFEPTLQWTYFFLKFMFIFSSNFSKPFWVCLAFGRLSYNYFRIFFRVFQKCLKICYCITSRWGLQLLNQHYNQPSSFLTIHVHTKLELFKPILRLFGHWKVELWLFSYNISRVQKIFKNALSRNITLRTTTFDLTLQSTCFFFKLHVHDGLGTIQQCFNAGIWLLGFWNMSIELNLKFPEKFKYALFWPVLRQQSIILMGRATINHFDGTGHQEIPSNIKDVKFLN